jgi:hypothetical protein
MFQSGHQWSPFELNPLSSHSPTQVSRPVERLHPIPSSPTLVAEQHKPSLSVRTDFTDARPALVNATTQGWLSSGSSSNAAEEEHGHDESPIDKALRGSVLFPPETRFPFSSPIQDIKGKGKERETTRRASIHARQPARTSLLLENLPVALPPPTTPLPSLPPAASSHFPPNHRVSISLQRDKSRQPPVILQRATSIASVAASPVSHFSQTPSTPTRSPLRHHPVGPFKSSDSVELYQQIQRQRQARLEYLRQQGLAHESQARKGAHASSVNDSATPTTSSTSAQNRLLRTPSPPSFASNNTPP